MIKSQRRVQHFFLPVADSISGGVGQKYLYLGQNRNPKKFCRSSTTDKGGQNSYYS